MKIFNWVHRRFNNRAENAKKNDDIAAEDQRFPIDNKCNHVFEGWRGGILAIGTLGYDPLKDDYFFGDVVVSSENDLCEDDVDVISYDSDEEEAESDGEEENPLVVSYNADEELTETEMEENWNHDFEYVRMKKKERTTLADLFYADSHHHDHIANKQQEFINEKSDRKRRLLFRNKLIAKEARPIHKLNQLMRRMLKRKIHPDVGPVNCKVATVNYKTRKSDDYASLLPTQDVNI